MAHLTEYFPIVDYDVLGDGNRYVLTNVTRRFKIRDEVLLDAASYFDYYVADGETAWMIADRYYDDPTLDWIILMTNDIVDPYLDWPLSEGVLDRYVRNKYPGSDVTDPESLNGPHHYERIVQKHAVLNDGTIVPESVVTVDRTSYDALPESDRRVVSNLEHERAANDEKRRIRVLDRQYVPNIVAEAGRIVS